jgi:hypothetical protein
MLEKYVGMYENITTYLKYVYELEYDEKPRYNYLSTFFE